MNILVINAGSSSIRSSLFKTGKELTLLSKSHIDGLNKPKCRFTFKCKTKNLGLTMEVKSYEAGIKLILDNLLKNGVIKSLKEIDKVGHRVVHGGEKYKKAIKINAKVIKDLENLCNLAPLHNPANISAIKACKSLLPKAKQIAVFDTAFYQTMPEKAYIYGLPYEIYEKHMIRRYGFHGLSHKSVTEKALKLVKKKSPKIISCHIGNGTSITASVNGTAIDTSMGFTPTEGPIMGTRCGTIDPSIIFHLENILKLKSKEIDHMMNFESGLLGISGISSDMRDIYAKARQKDKKAEFTIELLSYQLAKYCGSYVAALNGVDAIVFTGGIGESAFYVREKVCNYLSFLGVKLNRKKNEDCEETISDSSSKIKVFVLPANEETIIATESAKA